MNVEGDKKQASCISLGAPKFVCHGFRHAHREFTSMAVHQSVFPHSSQRLEVNREHAQYVRTARGRQD